MELKNAMNILFAKFGLNYRVLLYLFIVIAIVTAISVSIIIPSFSETFNSPEAAELFVELREGVGNFLSGGVSFSDFSSFLSDIFGQIGNIWHSTNAPVVFWVVFVIMIILIRFVSSYCYPVITDVVNSFMSSNMKYGFMSNMLKNTRLCLKYAFFHTLISSALDLVIVLIILGIVSGLFPFIHLFALAIGLLVSIVLFSLRLTLSSSILPEMIVNGETSYFKAIKNSLPSLKQYWLRLFGAYCITTFSVYSLILLLTVITFGIAFFVLSAMFLTIIHILQLVFYYGNKNMRYYTDGYTIINTAPIEDRIDLQDELLKKSDN